MGAVCPTCFGDSAVIDSRRAGDTVRRRRRCEGCGKRWTTFEVGAPVFKAMVESRHRIVAGCEALVAACQTIERVAGEVDA